MTPDLPWWARATQRPVHTPDQVARHRVRTVAYVTVSALAMLLVVLFVMPDANPPATREVSPGLLAHRQSTQALLGGCGPLFEVAHPDERVRAIPRTRADGTPNRARYGSIVPMYGPYYAQRDLIAPLDPSTTPPAGNTAAGKAKRFWSRTDTAVPGPEDLLGRMRQGHMVIWYARDVDAQQVANLRSLSRDPALNALVVPWEPMQRGALPSNRAIAYATWGRSQSCQRLSPRALAEFRNTNRL